METDIMGWLKAKIPACYQAILHAWGTLVDSVWTFLCQAPVVPSWKQNTCLLCRLPGIEGAPPSHTSDSTELQVLLADRKIAQTVTKRVRANCKSNESSSLIPAASQIMGIGSTIRPSVLIKGCLPKGYYLPNASD